MKKNFLLLLTLCFTLSSVQIARADEGMWLLTQLAKKYKEMKKRGLKMKEYDLYNPNGTSLKDAVVIFGRGCTGEIISKEGLVLTNHHCGYGAIQALSSLKHNYLEDGYWAKTYQDELPAKGLKVTFIDKIEDVTDYVLSSIKAMPNANELSYFSPKFLNELAKQKAGKLGKGIEVEIKPFYNGNQYLMFTKKVYSDIRFVAAPPSSIGKFGADTDNWAYPRHSGDFSIFRIYADAEGNPADYSEHNVPLKPKRWFNISTKGIEKGDFAMIMGFPGRTYHYFLPDEVKAWKEIDNDIRIQVRDVRQKLMLKEMLANPKTNIQYSAKYASSQNGYKRAIGANWGIKNRGLVAHKEKQMQGLLDWCKQEGLNPKPYQESIKDIQSSVQKERSLKRQLDYLYEAIISGMEFLEVEDIERWSEEQKAKFLESYDLELDKKISKALLTLYCKEVPKAQQPKAIRDGLEKYGSANAYIDEIFSHSAVLKLTTSEVVCVESGYKDPVRVFKNSIFNKFRQLAGELATLDKVKFPARRNYVAGLIKQYGRDNLWPDANFTLRFTFGNIESYSPRDGVDYEHQTYLKGVMEKEDPTSWEFKVADKLKEIYKKKSYGKNNRFAVKDKNGEWRMPVDFTATTHTTGGNSGSPVFNGRGELIGINFDRNWEGVAGDLQYLPQYQRSIICDIRYILMLIEEYGECPRLIDEMTLVD